MGIGQTRRIESLYHEYRFLCNSKEMIVVAPLNVAPAKLRSGDTYTLSIRINYSYGSPEDKEEALKQAEEELLERESALFEYVRYYVANGDMVFDGERYKKKSPPICECGGDKHGWPHSQICPKYSLNWRA